MPAWRDNFLARRWRGEVHLRVLFWRDMLLVGTFVNVLATFAALMAAALGAPTGAAAALHFAPLPYNAFLVLALWRQPGRPPAMAAVAAVWLVLTTVL